MSVMNIADATVMITFLLIEIFHVKESSFY